MTETRFFAKRGSDGDDVTYSVCYILNLLHHTRLMRHCVQYFLRSVFPTGNYQTL